MMTKKNRTTDFSDSYCVEYDKESKQFVIGLAKGKEEDFKINGLMKLDSINFKKYFLQIMKVLAQYQKDTGINLIEQILDDLDREGDNNGSRDD